jgi:hypothetical protein
MKYNNPEFPPLSFSPARNGERKEVTAIKNPLSCYGSCGQLSPTVLPLALFVSVAHFSIVLTACIFANSPLLFCNQICLIALLRYNICNVSKIKSLERYYFSPNQNNFNIVYTNIPNNTHPNFTVITSVSKQS